MSCTLRIRWTLGADSFPRPWRACARCGTLRPFECSGKFRLNANGRRLDAWLIYKCAACDDSWNHTLFERRNARDIDPCLLSELQANDPMLVIRFACDTAALRRHAHKVEEFGATVVRKEVLAGGLETPARLEITLAVPSPVALRLDRLLSAELGLSRARIVALAEAGHITSTIRLNQPVRDAVRIGIDLTSDDADVVLFNVGSS